MLVPESLTKVGPKQAESILPLHMQLRCFPSCIDSLASIVKYSLPIYCSTFVCIEQRDTGFLVGRISDHHLPVE